LGEIQGTPTIRLFKPKKKQRKPESNSDKTVVDYNFERKAKDMKQFIENEMTNYSQRITFGQSDLDKAIAKAKKFGLPLAILFTSKPRTAPMTKFLSTEFRRRILIAEVPPTKNNQEIMKQFGISQSSKDGLPLLIVIPPGELVDLVNTNDAFVRYDGAEFTKRKLHSFLSQHALSSPVYNAKEVPMASESGSEDQTTTSTKTSTQQSQASPKHVEL